MNYLQGRKSVTDNRPIEVGDGQDSPGLIDEAIVTCVTAKKGDPVRCTPGSHFSPHVHGGGEEFLVLEGVFQDEHGDYPAGTYVDSEVATFRSSQSSKLLQESGEARLSVRIAFSQSHQYADPWHAVDRL